MDALSPQDRHEILRRRTFAIISHPDAGKTTLTEKLLLFSGAIKAAGSVRPKKQQNYATSDWMAMEQARGISITSTVLQFEHRGLLFNLLDTPGHQDFSEDTYRTLAAVDTAIMVLDASKGIEPQTRKLFEVCRMRQIPILTFINKLDQPGRDPMDLLDEIEQTMGLEVCPQNWPVGRDAQFQGVVDLPSRRFVQYRRMGSQARSPGSDISVDSPEFDHVIGDSNARRLRETFDLLQGVIPPLKQERFLDGKQTPVFFGSAVNNFGVDLFLEAIARMVPPPRSRKAGQTVVDPLVSGFSAFVFKIQGNLDPMHRDSMAFLRICSGRFTREMLVHHPRHGRQIRMTRLHRLFARDREALEVAYAGDVVGVVNPGLFVIGDTVSISPGIEFEHLPSFQPEHFATLRLNDVSKIKQFRKGVMQLAQEGAIQVYYDPHGVRREPILGAVGRLQFDVVQSRLLQEYGARVGIDPLPYTCACWPHGEAEAVRRVRWPGSGVLMAKDHFDQTVCLFTSKWELQILVRENPEVRFAMTGGMESQAQEAAL